jgi:hypothetical protein
MLLIVLIVLLVLLLLGSGFGYARRNVRGPYGYGIGGLLVVILLILALVGAI